MNETHRFFDLEYCCDNNFDICEWCDRDIGCGQSSHRHVF